MTRETVKANLCGLMAAYTMVAGKKANSMELVSSQAPMVKPAKASGLRAKGSGG